MSTELNRNERPTDLKRRMRSALKSTRLAREEIDCAIWSLMDEFFPGESRIERHLDRARRALEAVQHALGASAKTATSERMPSN